MDHTKSHATLSDDLARHLNSGSVIPAMPLAQDEHREFDPLYQRALIRYYIDAGAGGLAVGVHSTQFNIRDKDVDLYRPVLDFASKSIDDWHQRDKPFLKIAGIAGETSQALEEANTAVNCGYHLGLLSLGAFKNASVDELIDHATIVGNVIPLMGFYLQPAVGGRLLPFDFWKQFAALPAVVAIKISPFNRYQTLDVVRGVAASGRASEIALYTGNDDNIVADLVTPFNVDSPSGPITLRFSGGLLGHWAVWTNRAVELFEEVKLANMDPSLLPTLLQKGVRITDMNAALFDVANNFHGCLSGIHEVLRRQGLRQSALCLDPNETLSPGQLDDLDRVRAAYPELIDDDFIAANLERWLK